MKVDMEKTISQIEQIREHTKSQQNTTFTPYYEVIKIDGQIIDLKLKFGKFKNHYISELLKHHEGDIYIKNFLTKIDSDPMFNNILLNIIKSNKHN